MFEISSEAHFSAAHHLRDYDGPCENVHGHNWLVRVTVRCNELNGIGIGVDFKKLKKLTNDVLDVLDHSDLNIVFNELQGNPSSENIARYIFENIADTLAEPNCQIYRVDVYETPGNCASYFIDA